MKKLVSAFAIAIFSLGIAQETPKKDCCKGKKECSTKDKKDCASKDKKECTTKNKKACCDTKGKKVA